MGHPFRHFWTITHHRHLVIQEARRVGIFWQSLKHDLSKYGWTEFHVGAKYYAGTHSPNDEQRGKEGYSLAWMHHKGRNPHHWEYWFDINPKTRQYEPVRIPIRYLKEMYCDRVAASRVYMKKNYDDSCPLKYYQRTDFHGKIHEDSRKLLESWLVYLKEHGRKETAKMIRKIKHYEEEKQ